MNAREWIWWCGERELKGMQQKSNGRGIKVRAEKLSTFMLLSGEFVGDFELSRVMCWLQHFAHMDGWEHSSFIKSGEKICKWKFISNPPRTLHRITAHRKLSVYVRLDVWFLARTHTVPWRYISAHAVVHFLHIFLTLLSQSTSLTHNLRRCVSISRYVITIDCQPRNNFLYIEYHLLAFLRSLIADRGEGDSFRSICMHKFGFLYFFGKNRYEKDTIVVGWGAFFKN